MARSLVNFVDWVRFVSFLCRSSLTLMTDSVTRSPLYTIYGETIAGVTVLRAFGASSKFLRDMLRYANTVRGALRIRRVATVSV